jgi:ketosteroid isomerase-like protein
MENNNQAIIDRFFAAYAKHDMAAIKTVMDENVKWYFLGEHPLAGVKNGIEEVIGFYDKVGKIMGESKPDIKKIIVAEKDDHLIECIHSKTNRTDEHNLEHQACVLWTFKDGKIIEGKHFFSNQQAINQYFNALAK